MHGFSHLLLGKRKIEIELKKGESQRNKRLENSKCLEEKAVGPQ